MESDPLSRIKDAALAGRMIEAIKMYREHHNVGLAEAKEAVEHLAEDLTAQQSEQLPLAKYQPQDHIPLSGTRQAAIQAALFGGEKIKAIQLYRELNPVGLAEAKAIIDSMEVDLRGQFPGLFSRPPISGTLGCLVVIFIFVALGYGVWRVMH